MQDTEPPEPIEPSEEPAREDQPTAGEEDPEGTGETPIPANEGEESNGEEDDGEGPKKEPRWRRGDFEWDH